MQAVQFYKAWDAYGALSNFSCHPIALPEGPMIEANSCQQAASPLDYREWRSVEHYYQSQKFATASGMFFVPAVQDAVKLFAHKHPSTCPGQSWQKMSCLQPSCLGKHTYAWQAITMSASTTGNLGLSARPDLYR